MSGLINSAGSKSGVIGTTELDYEEGVATVTLSAVSGGTLGIDSTYNELGYTKIGQLVQIQGYLQIGTYTSSPTSTIRVGALPFVGANFGTGASRPDFNPIFIHCRGTGSTDLVASGVMTPSVDYLQLELILAENVQNGTGFYITGTYTTSS